MGIGRLKESWVPDELVVTLPDSGWENSATQPLLSGTIVFTSVMVKVSPEGR